MEECVEANISIVNTLFKLGDGKRIPSLDGLRAVAVGMVIVFHIYLNLRLPYNRDVWNIFFVYGRFGVQIFFVISGFLITYLLLEEHKKTGKVDLLAFYRRRAFRILPASLVYIGVMALVFHNSIHPRYFVYALTYIMSYFALKSPWELLHLWSLSCEEQFYLIWPMVFFCAFAYRKRAAWGIMFLAPAFRLLFWKMKLDSEFYFPAVMDSLAAGCLLAVYAPQLQERMQGIVKSRIFVTVLFLATLGSPVFLLFTRLSIPFSGLISCLIALCVLTAVMRQDKFFNNKVIMYVGVLSYSLYLWQEPFLTPTKTNMLTQLPLNIVLAFCCAYLSYRFVEKPMLKYKAKVSKRVSRETVSVL